MATHINGIFTTELSTAIDKCKVLVVGAGGIGCELLKNLVLSGFEDLVVIDLDTIDVSNLNRQFLFHKQHVGKSKSKVATESAQRFNPKAKIESLHDSIISPEYGVQFYQKFNLVLNALDNRTARNHVNRMCLAAKIPLIESGSAGYLGQVSVIKKGITECYECQPKPTAKTFPGCTIRNTPSEPIHCIVWAKHLFNQLFGEADADEDVSPDSADPELVGDSGKNAMSAKTKEDGNIDRISTRTWAKNNDYNHVKLFQKFFNEDIHYLLSMDKLWQKRRAPTPLEWSVISQSEEISKVDESLIKDQRPWTLKDCCNVFSSSIQNLSTQLKSLKPDDHLVWDKDDEDAMDFVSACANIRASVFGISQKTRFDIKSMAGNIIPAIATTNAVIAGLIVLQAIKILNNCENDCRTVYLNRKPNPRKRLIVPCILDKPNPKCYVCSEKNEVSVQLNIEKMTVKNFEEKILKSTLNMVAPDVDTSEGNIIISSEPGETEANNEKTLKELSICDGTQLNCDDFLQEYKLCVTIFHCDEMDEGVEFKIIGDIDKLKSGPEETNKKLPMQNGTTSADQASSAIAEVEDDDLICLDDIMETDAQPKRKLSRESSQEREAKKFKEDSENGDIVIV